MNEGRNEQRNVCVPGDEERTMLRGEVASEVSEFKSINESQYSFSVLILNVISYIHCIA